MRGIVDRGSDKIGSLVDRPDLPPSCRSTCEEDALLGEDPSVCTCAYPNRLWGGSPTLTLTTIGPWPRSFWGTASEHVMPLPPPSGMNDCRR